MKIKRILITYLKNGDLKNEASKEAMYSRVIKELLDEGRIISEEVSTKNVKTTSFTDGSKVYANSTFLGTRNARLTHIYADKSILDLPNGESLINEVVKPCIIIGEHQRFDTGGNRLMYYGFDEGKLVVENQHKEE